MTCLLANQFLWKVMTDLWWRGSNLCLVWGAQATTSTVQSLSTLHCIKFYIHAFRVYNSRLSLYAMSNDCTALKSHKNITNRCLNHFYSICIFIWLFSSPEHEVLSELLWSFNVVVRASTISLNNIFSLTIYGNFTKLHRNDPWVVPYQSCSNRSSWLHKKGTGSKNRFSKCNFLTPWPTYPTNQNHLNK